MRSMTEGLSVGGRFVLLKTGLSYPLRLAPLDTSPFQKGRHVGGGFAPLPLTIRGGMEKGGAPPPPLSERGGERREAQRSLAIGKGKRSSPAFLPGEGKEAGGERQKRKSDRGWRRRYAFSRTERQGKGQG